MWPEQATTLRGGYAGRTERTADLRAEIGEWALNHVESSWRDETLEVVRIDMNGDSVAELFVHERVLSGNGGPIFFLFHRDGDAWRPIAQTMGWIEQLDTVKGWQRYSTRSSAGAGTLGRFLMEYCDGSYRTVRSERWNTQEPFITFETSKCEDAEAPF